MSITVEELAHYRWKVHEGEPMPEPATGGDYWTVGLDLLGGCQVCAASIAAYAYPTKSGFWCCAGCEAGTGYPTVEEADAAIFDGKRTEEEDQDASVA